MNQLGAGVLMLTRAMAVDLAPYNIRVNCVCPGPVRTGITDAIPEEAKQTFANRRTALRRYADPEEVAHATLSLVLPASSFITGATLLVDTINGVVFEGFLTPLVAKALAKSLSAKLLLLTIAFVMLAVPVFLIQIWLSLVHQLSLQKMGYG